MDHNNPPLPPTLERLTDDERQAFDCAVEIAALAVRDALVARRDAFVALELPTEQYRRWAILIGAQSALASLVTTFVVPAERAVALDGLAAIGRLVVQLAAKAEARERAADASRP